MLLVNCVFRCVGVCSLQSVLFFVWSTGLYCVCGQFSFVCGCFYSVSLTSLRGVFVLLCVHIVIAFGLVLVSGWFCF